jgi:hypothetical protein
MEALSSFTLMPVSHMNIQAVVSTIHGISDDKQADFAIHLGQCKHIKVGVIYHVGKNNVSIVTIFDNNYKYKVAYGKKSIEDLGDYESTQEPVLFDTSRFENIIVCPDSCECGGKGDNSSCTK